MASSTTPLSFLKISSAYCKEVPFCLTACITTSLSFFHLSSNCSKWLTSCLIDSIMISLQPLYASVIYSKYLQLILTSSSAHSRLYFVVLLSILYSSEGDLPLHISFPPIASSCCLLVINIPNNDFGIISTNDFLMIKFPPSSLHTSTEDSYSLCDVIRVTPNIT